MTTDHLDIVLACLDSVNVCYLFSCATAKTIYGMFVVFQSLKGDIGWQRSLIYQMANLCHFFFIKMLEIYPQYQKYHASMSVFMFCTFVVNQPKLYSNSSTESIALMIGFQSAMYLASAFLPY